MSVCNKEASSKLLKGDERKTFMSSCLKKDGAAQDGKGLTPQQQKMRECNAQATQQSLKGDDRSKFMSACLKKQVKWAGEGNSPAIRYCNQERLSFSDFSMHFTIASMTAERKPFLFQHAHGFDGGAAGRTHHILQRSRMLAAFEYHFGRAHHRLRREFISLRAGHSAKHSGVGHRFDKHKDVSRRGAADADHRMNHRLSNDFRLTKQRNMVRISAVSSALTSAFGVTDVIPALTSEGVLGIARTICGHGLRRAPAGRASRPRR